MHSKILFYFAIFSFMGWCLESIYKTIIEKKFINSGFLYGPFCPIYGFGAIIMMNTLGKLPQNPLVIFIAGTIFLTLWEYIVGVILEKIFHTKYWDYSHLKYNFQGRICLKNSIYWGILAVVFTFIIYPIAENLTAKIPSNILFYTNIIIYIGLIADVIITVTKMIFIDKKIEQLHEIGEMIKEKAEELKSMDVLEKVSVQNMVTVIANLKEEQAKIKKSLYRLITRLKNAFPTMQSETISKFINQKIDLKNIRNKIRRNKGE